MIDIERRNLPRVVEFRKKEGAVGTLFGYAAVYNRYSQNLGGFVEQVDPAAFRKSLADGIPVVARYNHSDAGLLGTTAAGTLVLRSDEIGLGYDVDLPNTTTGRDVSVLAERGDLQFSSFAFRTMRDDWSLTEQGFPLRTLYDAQLVDVAPVVTPAYLDTSSGMRSLAEKLDIDPGDILEMQLEEIRSLISGDTPPERRSETPPENSEDTKVEEQGDPHSKLNGQLRMLDLLKRR